MKRIQGCNLCFTAIFFFLVLGVGTGTATSQTDSAKDYQQPNLKQELQEVVEHYPLVAHANSSLLDHQSSAPCNLDDACFVSYQDFCLASGRNPTYCLENALAACCEQPVLAPPGTAPCPSGEPLPGNVVTSSSEVFTAAAKSLLPACNLPAEFGRCSCILDELQTSCDIVNRSLDAGFCMRVVE